MSIDIDNPNDYYYGQQIKTYITQFAQVFTGMKVSVGKNDHNSQSKFIEVPIIYGSPDKVVSAIKAENTQNKPIRVPIFSIKFEDITLNADRKSGTNTEYRHTVFPTGGDIKKDLKTLYRLKPMPYVFSFSVMIYTSNSDHLFQLLEQVLMLFDPMLQFQTDDTRYDWTKIVDAELVDVNIEDNRNPDNDGRLLMTSLSFNVNGYLSAPGNLRHDTIEKIRLRVEAVPGNTNLEEYINDSTRPTPEFIEIYNLEEADIPSN